ncbi:hypothetical protein I547_1580 [Mycobacterium kansasii 824]|nr:hypothetical protein I547_1580 [Mycobacterium kansasii 824]
MFRAVRIVGTALPAEAIPRVSEVRMPGQSAGEYDLPPGMTVNGAIARAWEAMLAAHLQWRTMLSRLPEGDPAIKLTREKWLLPLLYELGWGRPKWSAAGCRCSPVWVNRWPRISPSPIGFHGPTLPTRRRGFQSTSSEPESTSTPRLRR